MRHAACVYAFVLGLSSVSIGCGSVPPNELSEVQQDFPPSNEAFAQELLESGDGWQKVRFRGSAANGEEAKEFDEVVFIIQGTAGIQNVPLSKNIKHFFADALGTEPDDKVRMVSERIARAIDIFEETGIVVPELREIEEPADPPLTLTNTSELLQQPQQLHGMCDPHFITQSKTLALDTSLSQSFTLSSGVTATLGVSAGFSANATGDVTVKVLRKHGLFLCWPVAVEFVNAHLYGSATLENSASLQGTLATEHHWSLQVAKPSLGGVGFMAGPIPVWIGFSAPITVGYDIATNSIASVNYDGGQTLTTTFDYTCTLDGCSGNTNSTTINGDTPGQITADLNVRVKPSIWAQPALRASLYDDDIAYAQIGLKGVLNGDLWAYYGNNCGDANGDNVNETVKALTLDLDAQLFLTAQAAVLNGTPNVWPDLWHSDVEHLGYWDFMHGGSTRPMISGTSAPSAGTSNAYKFRMRPCWPYTDALSYVVDWGDQSASLLNGTPQTLISKNHTYSQAGTKQISVTAGTDAHGRVLNRSAQKLISVQ